MLAQWQNPYVEHLIGTIPRECLDHTLVLGEARLRRILKRTAMRANCFSTVLTSTA